MENFDAEMIAQIRHIVQKWEALEMTEIQAISSVARWLRSGGALDE